MQLHFATFFGNKCCDVSLPLLNSSVLLLFHHPGRELGPSWSLQSFSLPLPQGFTETPRKPSGSGQQNGRAPPKWPLWRRPSPSPISSHWHWHSPTNFRHRRRKGKTMLSMASWKGSLPTAGTSRTLSQTTFHFPDKSPVVIGNKNRQRTSESELASSPAYVLMGYLGHSCPQESS